MKINRMIAILAMASVSYTPNLLAQCFQGGPGGEPGKEMGHQTWGHGQFGKIHKADKFIGSTLKDQQGNNLGTVRDAAVDLESGRILYAVVSSGGQGDVALPATALKPGGSATEFRVNVDKSKFDNAPKFDDQQRQNAGDMNYITQVYRHFNQPTWWTGGEAPTATGRTSQGFGNVHLVKDLMDTTVQDTSNQDIGKVTNLALSFPGSRVLYVIFQPTGDFGDNNAFYAIPPMTFTKGSDPKTLTTGLDKNTLASAPHFTGDNWQPIQNPSYAANVYRHYGKETYWDSNLRPTGRDDDTKGGSYPPDTNPKQGTGASELKQREWSNPNEGGAGDPVQMGGPHSQPVKQLIGTQLKAKNGQNVGKVSQVLVDLESGRVLYALISTPENKQHAVPPDLFGANNTLKTDLQKVQNAPFPNQNQLYSPAFLSRLYNHYGLQTWWGGTPTGRGNNERFASGHGTDKLIGMEVKDSTNQKLGKISNVFVNMNNGRVSFLTLDASGLGQPGQVFPIPPMALTDSQDHQHLITGIDKNKLQSAPRVAQKNWQQLQDPSFAANVYQYYGKQPYWQDATSSQPESRIYPQ